MSCEGRKPKHVSCALAGVTMKTMALGESWPLYSVLVVGRELAQLCTRRELAALYPRCWRKVGGAEGSSELRHRKIEETYRGEEKSHRGAIFVAS